MTTTVTLTGNVSDAIASDFDPRRTKAYVRHNTDKVVTDDGPIHLGGGTVSINSDGTFELPDVVAATSLVENLQATVYVDYADPSTRQRATATFGPYDLSAETGTVDIRDLEEVQALPATAISQAVTTLQGYVDEGEDIRDETQAIRDGIIGDLGTTDSQTATLVNGPSLTSDALEVAIAASPDVTGKVAKGELVLNVKDYGAVGDGTTDDTAAIQAVLDALPATGGILYFPLGTYKVSSALAVTKPCQIFGAGYASNIRTSSATANIFTISGQFVLMRDLRMTTSVTRTAGWYVDVLAAASRFCIEDFSMDSAIGGIRTAAVATSTISNGMILNGTAGTGVAVRIDDGVDVSITNLLVDAAAQTFAGVYVTNAGDVVIADSQLLHAGSGLHVNAAPGDVVASVWSRDTFFDNCTTGVLISAAGGSVVRSRFTSCWMSSATGWGVRLTTSFGGTIDGTDILGCHIFLNGDGGILLNTTDVYNTRIADSTICDNTSDAGILVNAAATGLSIVSNLIGAGFGFGGNGYGIFFNTTTVHDLLVVDNDLTDNTVAAIGGSITSGINRLIANNLGDTTRGATGGIAVTASPFTYTAGSRYETVYINGGTVSLVKVDGVGAFQQTNCTVRLAPGKSVEITYTSAPGMASTKD